MREEKKNIVTRFIFAKYDKCTNHRYREEEISCVSLSFSLNVAIFIFDRERAMIVLRASVEKIKFPDVYVRK